MVCADFEGLVTSHDQSCLAILLVLEQTNVPSASFLPFSRLTIKLEELGSHLEDLLFQFLVGLDIDLLRQADHRLEFHIDFFLVGLVLC